MHSAWVHRQHTPKNIGFTIVELLIVIVVIAILAAITLVAYNGIQNRAKASAAQSAAAQAGKKVAAYGVINSDTYPQDEAAFLLATELSETNGITYEYSSTAPYTSYCLTTTTNNLSYYTSNTVQKPTAGGCAGHGQNGQAAVTNYATNPHAVSGGAAWTNQTPTGSTVSYQATLAQDGGSVYQVITNASGAAIRMGMAQSVGTVAVGDVLYVQLEVYAPAATTVQIEVGEAGVYPKSSNINLAVGWNQVSGTVTMIAAGSVTLVQIVSTTNVASGQTWRATKGFISKGSTPYQYADGTSTNWVWNGTANASTSKGPGI